MYRAESRATFLIVLAISLLLSQRMVSAEPFTKIRRLAAQHKNITVHFYSFKAENAEQIRNAINERGPVDQFGKKRDAFTGWYIGWRWPERDGKADFSETSAFYTVKFILPKWQVSKASAEGDLYQAWLKYLSAMEEHELTHYKTASSNYQRPALAIRNAFNKNRALSTDVANDIGEAVLVEIRKLDKAYDKKTKHGRLEGVLWPPKELLKGQR